jgi:hypothetical protein
MEQKMIKYGLIRLIAIKMIEKDTLRDKGDQKLEEKLTNQLE